MVAAFPRLGLGLFRCDPAIPLELFAQLVDIISATNLSSIEDSIIWSITSSQVFTIKSCYNVLNDGGLRSPFKNTIWKSAVPLKVKIFSWLTLKDKILSRANLIKRGWQGPSHYYIYGHQNETVMHIFFSLFYFQINLEFSFQRCKLFAIQHYSKSGFFFEKTLSCPSLQSGLEYLAFSDFLVSLVKS